METRVLVAVGLIVLLLVAAAVWFGTAVSRRRAHVRRMRGVKTPRRRAGDARRIRR